MSRRDRVVLAIGEALDDGLLAELEAGGVFVEDATAALVDVGLLTLKRRRLDGADLASGREWAAALRDRLRRRAALQTTMESALATWDGAPAPTSSDGRASACVATLVRQSVDAFVTSLGGVVASLAADETSTEALEEDDDESKNSSDGGSDGSETLESESDASEEESDASSSSSDGEAPVGGGTDRKRPRAR